MLATFSKTLSTHVLALACFDLLCSLSFNKKSRRRSAAGSKAGQLKILRELLSFSVAQQQSIMRSLLTLLISVVVCSLTLHAALDGSHRVVFGSCANPNKGTVGHGAVVAESSNVILPFL
jgi:hypothetical protein